MKTAFVSQLEKDYLEVYPQPHITAENLLEAAGHPFPVVLRRGTDDPPSAVNGTPP